MLSNMLNLFFTGESKCMDSLVWFLCGCLFIFVDILSRRLLFYRSVSIFPWLGIHGFANDQFAFSIALSSPVMYTIYFMVISAVGYYIWTVNSSFNRLEQLCWVLIVSGAFGNVLERLYLGYVQDFLQIGTGYINLGDVYIILGIVCLLYRNVIVGKKSL